MNLTKYNSPELSTWSPFSDLRNHINRLFDLSYPTRGAESFGDWAPALDASEDKDKYLVSVEIPGMKKEDINVTVHDGVLTVSGERKSEKSVNEGTVHRTERYFGKFSRSVSLPAAVKADKVAAAYRDGVLTVEIPKAEEAKPRQIDVKVS
jgi:HSP20 family protein